MEFDPKSLIKTFTHKEFFFFFYNSIVTLELIPNNS